MQHTIVEKTLNKKQFLIQQMSLYIVTLGKMTESTQLNREAFLKIAAQL